MSSLATLATLISLLPTMSNKFEHSLLYPDIALSFCVLKSSPPFVQDRRKVGAGHPRRFDL